MKGKGGQILKGGAGEIKKRKSLLSAGFSTESPAYSVGQQHDFLRPYLIGKKEADRRSEVADNKLAGYLKLMLRCRRDRDLWYRYSGGDVTPDYLSTLFLDLSVTEDRPADSCTGGGGNYFAPEMPRLPSHCLLNR